MTFQNVLTRPRAYVDWAVPKDRDGNDIGVCTEDGAYHHYLEWLADYLYEADIPVPESQQPLLEHYREKGGADHAVSDLSDCMGYSCWETGCIQKMSATGAPFEEHHKLEMEAWNSLSEEERADWNEEEFFTPENDYLRLGIEYTASQQVPPHIRHADIPYRPILASLLKEIPDAKERYGLLDYFYWNMGESASK